jgi:glycosyltransferase involved in cell wall biosynthesis
MNGATIASLDSSLTAMDRPLRIAMFSDSALPILNGVSVSIDALVDELRSQGHSVTLFTSRHPEARDTSPNVYRFPAMETPWTRGYPLAFPPFYSMLRKFRRHEFDVIHSHTPFTVGFVGLRWAESHGIPIVSTYHTLYDRYAHYIPLPRRYVRFKIAKHTNYYYNRVDHVIVPSEAAQKWLIRHAVETEVSIIPTGAPRPGFIDRGETRQELGIRPDERIMLYVGRLAQEKNLETLFEMAAIAFQEDPSLRLWLVGDGPHQAECRARVRRLGIGDRVKFAGFVPRKEVDNYYAAADLFVFASISETQGLVVQEAMAHGLPAVAVAGGGASEAVEDGVNGLLVRQDASEFASSVLRVLHEDQLYARLSAEATTSVRRHGVSEMCEAVLGVYRHVIGPVQSRKRETVRIL